MVTVIYSGNPFLTDHVKNYSNPKILARDNNSLRLEIKEIFLKNIVHTIL